MASGDVTRLSSQGRSLCAVRLVMMHVGSDRGECTCRHAQGIAVAPQVMWKNESTMCSCRNSKGDGQTSAAIRNEMLQEVPSGAAYHTIAVADDFAYKRFVGGRSARATLTPQSAGPTQTGEYSWITTETAREVLRHQKHLPNIILIVTNSFMLKTRHRPWLS